MSNRKCNPSVERFIKDAFERSRQLGTMVSKPTVDADAGSRFARVSAALVSSALRSPHVVKSAVKCALVDKAWFCGEVDQFTFDGIMRDIDAVDEVPHPESKPRLK